MMYSNLLHQSDEHTKTEKYKAVKINGNIFVTTDNWKTYKDIVYLDKKTQDEIKQSF